MPISTPLLWTLLTGFMLYHERSNLFDWTIFNPHGLNNLIFLFFILVGVLLWLFHFDKRPESKLDEAGIWKRKNPFKSKFTKIADWTDIEYYYEIQETTKEYVKGQLFFGRKDFGRPFTFPLKGENVSSDEVLSFIKTFGDKFNFKMTQV